MNGKIKAIATLLLVLGCLGGMAACKPDTASRSLPEQRQTENADGCPNGDCPENDRPDEECPEGNCPEDDCPDDDCRGDRETDQKQGEEKPRRIPERNGGRHRRRIPHHPMPLPAPKPTL